MLYMHVYNIYNVFSIFLSRIIPRNFDAKKEDLRKFRYDTGRGASNFF